ncbi:hypothetical protein BDV29DRAFT_191529 [Aspergillus leporis]|uniref:Enoyl reductase (ER) domain-containing protein n=1 Tax=Aspergillus leporis TaxID=41062 RepID=A0A5N5WZ97_9EURO|nr:hypothetical protein BDV29DRAFT_191529 [Aspergillus leporis]
MSIFNNQRTSQDIMIPTNVAAYVTGLNQPLEIKPSLYPSPSDNEILICNHAVAINWLIEVRSSVARSNPGDRLYTVVRGSNASLVPDSLSYEQAAVVPLGIVTTASGMFQKDFLALDLPEPERRKSNGQTSLIWGGSTSLGCNAIQMAMAAGYEVVTRASEKKFELVRSLGATTVLHNHSTGIVAELIDALKEKKSVGALAITFASAEPCVEVISMADEGKFVAAALPLPELKDTEAEAKMIWG